MKHFVVLLFLLITASCVRKVEVSAPEFVREQRYSYVKDDNGTMYVVTTNTQDFNEAIEKLKPGPASVDKLNLWVIRPLKRSEKPE
jgi:hypothetical protein